MSKEKSFSDFNMKDWKNFGIYLVLFGLIIMFVGKQWSLGLAFCLVGIILLAIFQGPKIFKILKKKNW